MMILPKMRKKTSLWGGRRRTMEKWFPLSHDDEYPKLDFTVRRQKRIF